MSADLDARLQELVQLARDGRTTAFIERAWELEPADLGDVLAALDEDERVALVRLLPAELSSQALIEMPEDAHAEETLAALDPGMAADIVEELEDVGVERIVGDDFGFGHEESEKLSAHKRSEFELEDDYDCNCD